MMMMMMMMMVSDVTWVEKYLPYKIVIYPIVIYLCVSRLVEAQVRN